MKKIIKNEIKENVKKALGEVVQTLKISKLSRKTKRSIEKASKALRAEIKKEMQRQVKNATKQRKTKLSVPA